MNRQDALKLHATWSYLF